jgi:putative transposase
VERTIKLRVRVGHATYSALKEVEKGYREVLKDAINHGLSNKTTSFTRIMAGVHKTEREKHKGLSRSRAEG